MVTKREIEQALMSESIVRMAERIRGDAVLNEEDLPPWMPDFLKDTIRQTALIMLAIVRISELSRWN